VKDENTTISIGIALENDQTLLHISFNELIIQPKERTTGTEFQDLLGDGRQDLNS